MKKLKLPSRKTATDTAATSTTRAAEPKHQPKAKSKRRRGPKPAKLIGSWQLFRHSLRDLRTDWKPYTKILAIVAVPSDIVAQIPTFSGDALFSAISSLAALFMNVALLWAVVRRQSDNLPTTVAQAYYDGSVALARFLMVSLALVVMLVPFAFGASLYATALLSPLAEGPTAPEQILVALVAIALSLPSFYMLVRFGLAPFAAVQDNLRPVAALRRSRLYTLGRFWPVAGRFVILIPFLALVSIPATILALLLGLFKLGGLATILWEIAASLIALPIANLYLLRLYRNLAETLPPADAPADAAIESQAEPVAPESLPADTTEAPA